jgi:hypothetical protein
MHCYAYLALEAALFLAGNFVVRKISEQEL